MQVRYPNTSCCVCKKEFYRRPFEFKEGTEFCCRSCRSKLYKAKTSIWKDRLQIGWGWNKGKSKKNGDILVYGKPRQQSTKQKISQKLQGRIFSPIHKENISKARIALFDIIGRQPIRRKNGKCGKWRESVLKRDNYTCQQCNSKENLHAHHIKPWRYYPELRYEITNGLTLCVTCHRKTDSWGCKKIVLQEG